MQPGLMTPVQIRTLWLTAPVILGVVVYLLALDVWLVRAAPDDEATISATYGKLVRQWPVVNTIASFLFGIVVGHITWGRDWSKSGQPIPPDDLPPADPESCRSPLIGPAATPGRSPDGP